MAFWYARASRFTTLAKWPSLRYVRANHKCFATLNPCSARAFHYFCAKWVCLSTIVIGASLGSPNGTHQNVICFDRFRYTNAKWGWHFAALTYMNKLMLINSHINKWSTLYIFRSWEICGIKSPCLVFFLNKESNDEVVYFYTYPSLNTFVLGDPDPL